MGKIATEQEAYDIGKQGTPNGNKCCTKSRAEALGCTVKDDIPSNKLVQISDILKTEYIDDYTIIVHTGINGTLYLENSKGERLYRDYTGGILLVATSGQGNYKGQISLTIGETITGYCLNSNGTQSNIQEYVIPANMTYLYCDINASPYSLSISSNAI